MQSTNVNQYITNSTARTIGLTLVLGIAIVIFGQFFVSSKLIVPDNSVDTAKNIIAHEARFRTWIICNILYIIDNIVLLSALYLIFKPINHSLSFIATIFKLIYVVMWAIIVLNLLSTFRLLTDTAYTQVYEIGRLQILARLNLRANIDSYYVGLPFYALSSTIFSYLWLKSKFIPKALAGFGIVASIWCVFCAVCYLALPNFDKTINLWWFDTPMAIIFDVILGLWLLVKGLKK